MQRGLWVKGSGRALSNTTPCRQNNTNKGARSNDMQPGMGSEDWDCPKKHLTAMETKSRRERDNSETRGSPRERESAGKQQSRAVGGMQAGSFGCDGMNGKAVDESSVKYKTKQKKNPMKPMPSPLLDSTPLHSARCLVYSCFYLPPASSLCRTKALAT